MWSSRIGQPGAVPMGIAGIYRECPAPGGRKVWTMSMLTVNAADHPVMKRFHKPGEEKRMVVILDPAEYREWLTCSVQEASKFFRQWMGSLETSPRVVPTSPPRRPPATAQGDLL